HDLPRRQIPRELVQEAYELPDVGRSRDRSAVGEPVLELGARGTARRGAPQEVAQPVRADGDLARYASHRMARGFACDRIPEQGHWQRGQTRASRRGPGAAAGMARTGLTQPAPGIQIGRAHV